MARKTCDCGRIYEITKYKLIQRDSDSIDCKCGLELMRWNGGVMYSSELIRDIDPADKE